MKMDWNTVKRKAAGFRTLDATSDPDKGIIDVAFSGLEVKLSEINSEYPAGSIGTLYLYADTFIVDEPMLRAPGSVIVARHVDLSQLAHPLEPLKLPAAPDSAAEFLVQETTQGVLRVAAAEEGSAVFRVPVGSSPLKAGYYFIDSDGQTSTVVNDDAATLQDLLDHIYVLNSLKASFSAASWLMTSDDDQDVATARSMLNWIVTCIRTVGAAAPQEFMELYHQAAALLVTLNSAPGAYFVPALSTDYYRVQASSFVDALQSYEAALAKLEIETDIHSAIDQLSSTLAGVAQDEAAPLHSQLKTIEENIKTIDRDVRILRLQYDNQYVDVQSRYAFMELKIAEEHIVQFLAAVFKLSISVVSASVDVALIAEGDVGTIADLIENIVTAGEEATKAIENAAADGEQDRSLLTNAKELIRTQIQVGYGFQAGAALWDAAQKGDKGAKLPSNLAAVVIDPDLAWNNYMIDARAELTSIKEEIGGDEGSGPAQEAANKYLASLEILAQYGKAINIKFVAYASQLAQAAVIMARLEAAENVMARWEELASTAREDKELVVALKGVLQTRADSNKRSVFLAWTYYRDAFFYLNLIRPPVTINMDMNAAQMKTQLAKVTEWIGRLLGDDPGGTTIKLPDDNVELNLNFKLVKQGDTANETVDSALFTPAANGQLATLTWAIPMGSDQLAGQLPEYGDVAIWITEATFFIDGVQANRDGNVIVKISTSGSYQNGFSKSGGYNFITKGLTGNYIYSVSDEHVRDDWRIDTAVYMTPTPFTQWTMTFDPNGGDPATATTLRMNLKVSYLESNS